MRIIYRVAVCDDMARDLEEMASVTATLLREAGMETRVERFRSAVELLILKDYVNGERTIKKLYLNKFT